MASRPGALAFAAGLRVHGKPAETCARYLAKGRPVAADGRLEWHEWDQHGTRRSAIAEAEDVVAPATFAGFHNQG